MVYFFLLIAIIIDYFLGSHLIYKRTLCDVLLYYYYFFFLTSDRMLMWNLYLMSGIPIRWKLKEVIVHVEFPKLLSPSFL